MIHNTDDIIDSRDVIARIAELEEGATDGDRLRLELLDENDLEELLALKALADEGESISDWTHGEALIRDSYFEDYARELAEDIGAVDPQAAWPNSYIDWEAASDALKMDYTDLDFDGVTYWARA